MSTVERPRTAILPLLVPGEHLDQPAFRERYETMPPRTRAELIGGVVFMPPMLGSDHGDDHVPMVGLLFLYQRATPGVRANIESTTVLNDRNEVQPDCSLRILTEYGGQTTTVPKWIEGAPEMIVEIARSSQSIDLGLKLEEYQRAGVKEYVVLALDPDDVFWHVRRDDRLVAISPGDGGIYRSEVFPASGSTLRRYFASTSTPSSSSSTEGWRRPSIWRSWKNSPVPDVGPMASLRLQPFRGPVPTSRCRRNARPVVEKGRTSRSARPRRCRR